jgi:DNA-binding transcriptional regulator YhcF (GntR family)
VNVFSLLNHFFRENEREKVSSSATKLYFFLIYEANKSYWEGPLMFSERKLSSLLSFSKNTVSKCLSELEDRGLITCYPRKGNGLMANEEDSLTANEEGSLTANEEGSLTANKEDGITGNKRDSLTANVKGKEAFSSTFWFPEVQLRKAALSAPKGVQGKTVSSAPKGVQGKTASRQMRAEKKDVYNKGVRYNVHRGENSLTAHKGGSKYAKFF